MAEKKLEGAGLRGQVAGQTALSTVGKEGKGLPKNRLFLSG
mgnify:CR=1 FL=1